MHTFRLRTHNESMPSCRLMVRHTHAARIQNQHCVFKSKFYQFHSSGSSDYTRLRYKCRVPSDNLAKLERLHIHEVMKSMTAQGRRHEIMSVFMQHVFNRAANTRAA